MNDNHVRMAQNYRNAYIRLALYVLNEMHDEAKAIQVLQKMDENIPRNTIAMDYRIKHDIARLLFRLNATEDYMSYANELIATANKMIEQNPMKLQW